MRLVGLMVIVALHMALGLWSFGTLFGMSFMHSLDQDHLLKGVAQVCLLVTHLPLLLPLEATHVGRQVINVAWPVIYMLNSVLAVGSVVALSRLWRRRRTTREST